MDACGVAGLLLYGQRALQSGGKKRRLILNPPQPEEILQISLSGEKMPQKTTYFYPKLIDGLVINRIDLEEEIAES